MTCLGIYIIGFALGLQWQCTVIIYCGIGLFPIVGLFIIGFICFVVRVQWILRRYPAQLGQDRTLIVLGFYIEHDQPSIMLKRRLDRAYEYLSQNVRCHCILTGGQGPNEDFPESLVMQKYLMRQKVSARRLFREEFSHNTFDNIVYAKEIISLQNLNQKIVLVSDGFHLYRALLECRGLGLDCQLLPSKTPWTLWLSNWMREYFAVLRYYAINRYTK